MNTNETLAQDGLAPEAQQAVVAPETKARRPGAPAVHTRSRPDPLAALTRQVARQTAQIKAISSADARRRLAEAKGRATHALRATVDERTALARRGRSDVLLSHKLDRINATLNRLDRTQTADRLARRNADLVRENRALQTKLARPRAPALATRGRGGYSARSQAFAIYRKASLQYLRTGQETFGGVSLRELERKAGMHTESNPDGGYLVHPEYDTGPLEGLLRDSVVMRQVATVRTISGPSFKKPVNLHGGTVEWVGERQDRPDTKTPDIAELDFPAMELAARIIVTQTLLEDSAIDLEAYLAEEVNDDFSEEEERVFTGGNAVNKPHGFLAYPTVANADWAWGKLGVFSTGADGDFPEPGDQVNQGDPLWDVIYGLKAGARANARWMMNSGTAGKCRQLKDGEGRWIWSDARDDNPNTLCGFEVTINEQMPAMETDAFAIAFGDVAQGYLIVDRVGMSVLRDPYTRKPYVEFYTRKRVGGGVKDFEAIKLLKFASG